MRNLVAAAALGWLALMHPVHAQGIPVIDTTAIAKQIEQLVESQKQLKQLQDLHSSLNKLTGMGDIASLLSNPAIRQALPKEFAAVEGLLRGQGGTASIHRQQDEVFTPGGNARLVGASMKSTIRLMKPKDTTTKMPMAIHELMMRFRSSSRCSRNDMLSPGDSSSSSGGVP